MFFLFSLRSVVGVVQWNEDLYERQLIERTIDACEGRVDVVIDFGTTSRSLHRSMQCLTAGGWVLISSQVAERLQPKFSRLADELQVHIEPVEPGTVSQLHELVDLVASGQVCSQQNTLKANKKLSLPFYFVD